MSRLILAVIFLTAMMTPLAWAKFVKYPNPYRQTMWNSFTDSIHTIGQSGHQATATKMKLHNMRTNARLRSINQARRNAWLNGR